MNVTSLAAAVGLVVGSIALAATPAVADEPPAFVPHRAVYDLDLDGPITKSQVRAARGRIVYEFSGNACEGWAMSLRQVVQIEGADERSNVSDTLATSWEDAAAKTFRFANQSSVDRASQDVSEGRAERGADGRVTVKIAKPADGEAALGAGVVFPTEHMRRLVEAARKGERIVSAKVFDGTESGHKVYDTMSVVGRPIEPGTGALEAAAQRPELAGLQRWPVTVSYFDAASDSQTPLYTLGFELFENGISRNLTLDYGDFRLRGEMATLELLAPMPCP
ncbi:cell envelope integrity EipB family protein [Blastochloris viridis]|uniref:ATP/GTP-binding site motif A n=1 Tax=Blastochloris viridis TaxID=1079 RepID=A0A0H5BI92_BLAVI|nr:cell envelope integrity EipB family protein [Blastochloris viridis]ALK09254.1 hypothetical protein BVIR_1471 [Blastochloris viridis]BAS00875.1 hypothetical protein BV133_3281 [Blastochloris viridis]CUU41917.1 hypothetical protein BVIRIDIS_09160 [Blastochloris viridis]